MKIEYLREFVLLSQKLNFSATAEQLFISQSALSRHISIIEGDLGSKLLERDTHSVVLTKAGIEAARRFSDILSIYDNQSQAGAFDPSKITGHLSIGLLYFAIAEYYGEFLQNFSDKYPGIELEIKNYHPHHLYYDVLNKKVDIGECPTARGLMSKDLVFHKLEPAMRSIACIPAKHPLAQRSSLCLRDLHDLPLIDLEDDHVYSAATWDVIHRCGMMFKEIHYAKNIETAPIAILKYNGVVVGGDRISRQAYPGISYLPIDDDNATIHHYLIHLSDNPNTLIPLFVREALSWFKEMKV